MVVTMSTLALLATGLKAVTWTWFSFKAIKLACKLGKSINLEAKKGRQPLPKFQSGRVEKFYKGTSKKARPRLSRNKEKLAEKRMEAIMEGSNVTIINNVDKKSSERQELLKVKEEIDEDRLINSMVKTNFSGCNNDCDCSNATEHTSEANLTASEDIATIAKDAAQEPSEDIATIAKDAAQELKSLWRNDVASDTPTKYTSIKARTNESMNCSLASSGDESQEDCHCSIILETPVKHGHAKSLNNGNIFEASILAGKNEGEFETLRNSMPATFPAMKCEFDLSFKIPKAQPPKSALIKQPKALQLLDELPEQSLEASSESHLKELQQSLEASSESHITDEDVEMTGDTELTDGDTTPILNRKFRGDSQLNFWAKHLEELQQSLEASSESHITDEDVEMTGDTDGDTTPILNRKFRGDSQLNFWATSLLTSPNVTSECQSASPPLRKRRAYKDKRVAQKDFSDVVYDEIVKCVKTNVSVDVANVLDAYENSKEVSDFLMDGGSISSKEITLKLTAAKEDMNSSDVEDMGAMQVSTDDASNLEDYTDPLGVWTPTLESVIPPWNKELLPKEALPQSLETPPTPPRVDKSLLTYLEKFEEEEAKPTIIEEILMKEDELKAVEGLCDVDEVMVSYDNFALIRTTPAAIRKSSGKDTAVNIGDRCENDDSPNDTTGSVLNDLRIEEPEENAPTKLSVDATMQANLATLEDDASNIDSTVVEVATGAINTENPDPISSTKVKKVDSFETARKNDSDVNISLGVSYELINVDSKGECQTDDFGRNIDSDTFNNTTKEVTGIEALNDNDEGNGNYSNSVIGDENDAGHVDDVDISLLVNYEASPNRREDVVNDNDVTLVSIKGDSAFINHTLPLINIKKESNEKTSDRQIRKEEPEENLPKSKNQVTGQEIIVISDDEDDNAGSPAVEKSTPEASVSSLERSIVSDLQLNINGQFQVEEIGE